MGTLGFISTLEAATGTITATAESDVSDDESVIIAGITYVWRSTLTDYLGIKYNHLDATANMASLVTAINGTGTAGTDYLALAVTNGNVPHPLVKATQAADVVTITSRLAGWMGDYLPITESTTGLSVSATLSGGNGSLSQAIDAIQAHSQINSEVISALQYLEDGE
jgi:hypothetical protein